MIKMKRIVMGLCGAAALAIAMRTLPVDGTTGSVKLQRPLMGTVWSVEVLHHGDPASAERAANAVFVELERIDRLMSEWKPESPVSAINYAAGKGMVEVPAELRALLERSILQSEKSSGAFDVTWRGMGRIWRFDDKFRMPSKEEVEKTRAMVNYRDLQIEGNRVGLKRAGMSIGLGGIAKGYAVDRAGAVLRNAGFLDYLVDGGGDILVSGTKGGRPWRLGVQDPRAPHGKLMGTVSLTRGVLVTSGDYERFRMVNGVRYHHIIDPGTGWPATASRSVTVIADTAEQAVVLAKVIFIRGAQQGLGLAREEGAEALILDAAGARHSTPGFDRQFESQ